jgi:cysteine-rich repeat protein
VADVAPALVLAGVLLSVGACGGDDAVANDSDTSTAADDDGDDSESDADDAPASSDDADSTDTTADDASSGVTTGIGPAECGDGERQGLEHCDDGNDTPGDGCEPGCTLPGGEPVWIETIDGEGGNDVANALAVTAEGGIVVVGGQTAGDAMDVWIARYDAGGESLSSVRVDLGEGGDDVANGVAILDDGAIAIVGSREQPSDTMLDDAIVAVIDTNDEVRWSVVIDDGLKDEGHAIAVGPAGIAVAGSREAAPTDDDAWFALYDVDGGEIWAQTEMGPGGVDDIARGIAWTPDGGLVVVGERGTGDSQDAWISGRDGNGDEVWTEIVDFDFGADFAADVVLVDDTAWITGMISSPLTNSEEIWIASYGLDGTPGDSTTWNSNGFLVDSGAGIVVDGGDVFIAGETAAADQQRNVFVGRFGSGMPEPVWNDTQDGGAGLQDRGTAIALLPDGSVVATGVLTVIGEGTNAWIRRYAP